MAWYENTANKSAIREYKSRANMDADIAAAGALGWRAVGVSEMSQRSGCMRMLTLGLFALVWKPKAHFMVTFQHD